jgi:menaquinone-9 beta-reductase
VEFPGARCDVFVVGGGPAGLATAIAAQRKQLSVIVADGAEPTVDKACGEGLLPDALAALREINLEIPGHLGVPFQGIQFTQKNTRISGNFPKETGLGIRRTVLHEFLIQHAEKCGVRLLWKTPVLGISGSEIRLSDKTVSARWIVGADGGRSQVRRWSGLDVVTGTSQRFAVRRHYRVKPWTIHMEVHWGSGVQAYVTPVSPDETCIVVMSEYNAKTSFDEALKMLPELQSRLRDADLASRERGAVSATMSLPRVWHRNVALVGDASGGVDAITGEGLRLAFRQAHLLADAMYTGDLKAYGRAHRKLAHRPMQIAKLMLYLARHDKFRSQAFRILSRSPKLFERLLAFHVSGARLARDSQTNLSLGHDLLGSLERG